MYVSSAFRTIHEHMQIYHPLNYLMLFFFQSMHIKSRRYLLMEYSATFPVPFKPPVIHHHLNPF